MRRSSRPFRAHRCFAALLVGLLWVGTPTHAAEPSGIAIIVARGAGGQDIDRHDLALIYKRKKRFWPEGQRIAPVNLSASQPLRRAFSSAVLGQLPEELDDYWRDQYFHGELPPFVVGSEEAVIRFVTATPGAVGYVAACTADKRVSVIAVVADSFPCPH